MKTRMHPATPLLNNMMYHDVVYVMMYRGSSILLDCSISSCSLSLCHDLVYLIMLSMSWSVSSVYLIMLSMSWSVISSVYLIMLSMSWSSLSHDIDNIVYLIMYRASNKCTSTPLCAPCSMSSCLSIDPVWVCLEMGLDCSFAIEPITRCVLNENPKLQSELGDVNLQNSKSWH